MPAVTVPELTWWDVAWRKPFKVEGAPLPFLEDSMEAHAHYVQTFFAAAYALIGTVAAMYVAVVTMVTQQMDKVGAKGGLLDACTYGYLMLYPLIIMIVIIVICLETVTREYVFYAYLRNRILLSLEDANDNMFSADYWLRPSYGWFPHVAVFSTIVLGLCTGGWVVAITVVAVQVVNLILFYNSIIGLKKRLVSVSQFVEVTISAKTRAARARLAGIRAEQHKLHTAARGVDLDGDGKADLHCCFVSDSLDLSAPKSPQLAALDAAHDAAWEAEAAAARAGMVDAVALLSSLEIVTEDAARADALSLSHERKFIRAQLKAKKLSKAAADAKLAALRYSFGEADPATGARLPTLGMLRRAAPPMTAATVVANVLYMGLFNKMWAATAGVSARVAAYHPAAATHAVFARRNSVLLMGGFASVVLVEIYGIVKGAQALQGSNDCTDEMVKMCASAACYAAVCSVSGPTPVAG